MIYRFGECVLDTHLYSVQRGGETFRLRPKAFRVCLYLLEHRNRVVSREELCAQVWPGRFASQATLEGVIRSVRQALGDNGRTQGIILTLHGYGYRFVASVEGESDNGVGGQASMAAASLAASAASTLDETDVVAASSSSSEPEKEPEGMPDIGRHDEIRRSARFQNGQRMDGHSAVSFGDGRAGQRHSAAGWRVRRAGLTTALVILVLVGGLGLWQGVGEQASPRLEKSRIAVLPFIDLSAELNHVHFADGMTEELIGQLARVRGLTVIARTSVMQYKDTRKDVATIGRELQVGTILEGSVRRIDNRVRVSAQLIDVTSQGHVWSQGYDRELMVGFSAQSDIAAHMVQQLKVQLKAEPVYDGLRAKPWLTAVLPRRPSRE